MKKPNRHLLSYKAGVGDLHARAIISSRMDTLLCDGCETAVSEARLDHLRYRLILAISDQLDVSMIERHIAHVADQGLHRILEIIWPYCSLCGYG